MTQETNFKRLQQLKDTDISSPTDLQVLAYITATGKWEPRDSVTSLTAYSFTGADCAGSNPNKTLDVGVSSVKLVYIESGFIHPTTQWTQLGTVITFNGPSIIDIMKITVYA